MIHSNIASFLLDRVETRPGMRFGVPGDLVSMDDAVLTAQRILGTLQAVGVQEGTRIAIIAPNSTEFLVFWIACQLGGFETALINPRYPDELLEDMLAQLQVDVLAGPRRTIAPLATSRLMVDLSGGPNGSLLVDGEPIGSTTDVSFAGLDRDPLDVAGYMHTSGTTGAPKFCAHSHRYYLSLARFFADSFCLGPHDRVFAPLPMFHANPFGYGFMGALYGLSDLVTVRKFSASGFWATVREQRISVLVLHQTPVTILKRQPSHSDPRTHMVRAMFFADPNFMERFDVPVGVSCYGSTEAGGLTHIWHWRRGEVADLAEGMSRYAGDARPGIEWDVSDEGEILVRDHEPGLLFSGYLECDGLDRARDDEGWFHTGDLGRVDEHGRLVFRERMADAIRVRGEFVPIHHVEEVFGSVDGLTDVAVWKRPGDLDDDRVVLFVVAEDMPVKGLIAAGKRLPRFMRPSEVVRVETLPRDNATGKVNRSELEERPTLSYFVPSWEGGGEEADERDLAGIGGMTPREAPRRGWVMLSLRLSAWTAHLTARATRTR